jgi:hypothetical protein
LLRGFDQNNEANCQPRLWHVRMVGVERAQ